MKWLRRMWYDLTGVIYYELRNDYSETKYSKCLISCRPRGHGDIEDIQHAMEELLNNGYYIVKTNDPTYMRMFK